MMLLMKIAEGDPARRVVLVMGPDAIVFTDDDQGRPVVRVYKGDCAFVADPARHTVVCWVADERDVVETVHYWLDAWVEKAVDMRERLG